MYIKRLAVYFPVDVSDASSTRKHEKVGSGVRRMEREERVMESKERDKSMDMRKKNNWMHEQSVGVVEICNSHARRDVRERRGRARRNIFRYLCSTIPTCML